MPLTPGARSRQFSNIANDYSWQFCREKIGVSFLPRAWLFVGANEYLAGLGTKRKTRAITRIDAGFWTT